MHRSSLRRRSTASLALAALVLTFAGCQNYTQQTADFSQAWKTADLQTATSEISKKADAHKDDKDTIVWHLEKGAVLRAAALAKLAPPAPANPGANQATALGGAPAQDRDLQLLEESNAAFETAQAKIVRYENDAKLKLGSETFALLSNQSNQPYRGHAYDKIMLHTYLAANYMKLDQPDKARVEFNRLLQTQRDAVEENAKRIEKAREEAENARYGENGKPGYDVNAAQQDPNVAGSLSNVQSELDAQVRGYEDYVNPFSVFLEGLFFSVNAEGNSDMERARKSLQRAASMSPDNPYLRDDLAIANELHSGKNLDGLTYVIFETGSAPFREEFRIDLPIFAVTNRISYIGAAFPRLRFDNEFVSGLNVVADGAKYPTSLVGSMDSVIAQDFKNEWPSILTRTILSVAIKATADAAIQNQVKDKEAYVQFLAQAFTAITQASTNIADTRSWTTLPKEFQYCRFPTPKDGKVSLQIAGATQEITLEKGSVNLIWVKNVGPNLPSYVSQVVLKK